MRILLTGGSGFIGRHMRQQLIEEGHDVRILARGTRSPSFGAGSYKGSVLDPETLPPALKDCDAVIHLVGIIAEVREQTYDRVHVQGTQNVVQATEAMGIRRFIHMSALGSRPNAIARYHVSKWRAEEIVRGSSVEWTIHRPSLVYGPGDGFVTLFERLTRWSPILPVICGDSRVQPIAVEDVANGFVRSLDNPKSRYKTYDLCGPTALTWQEVFDTILSVTNRRRLKLPIPNALARVPAWLGERTLAPIAGKAPPLTRDQLQMLTEDNVGEPGPMRQDFLIEPVPFAEGLSRWLGKEGLPGRP